MAVLHSPGSGDVVLPTLDQVRITRCSGAIQIGKELIRLTRSEGRFRGNRSITLEMPTLGTHGCRNHCLEEAQRIEQEWSIDEPRATPSHQLSYLATETVGLSQCLSVSIVALR